MQNQELVLMLSAAALMLLLAVISQRRSTAARARLERVKREADLEDLGGNSYFMPPPPLEQAVELDDAVEIDSLLSGEPETVAAQARRQLERTTDVDLTGGLRNLSFSLATPAPPAAPVPSPLPQRRADPPGVPVAGSAANATNDDAAKVPVRELVLAWFEARGYRPAALPPESQPIELLLRHSKTPERAYAFMVVREGLTAQRVSSLFTLARSSGFKRLLIASDGEADPALVERVRPQGVRIFDETRIRSELGKIDIRIAAKIIAVARGRAATRRIAPRGPAQSAAAATH